MVARNLILLSGPQQVADHLDRFLVRVFRDRRLGRGRGQKPSGQGEPIAGADLDDPGAGGRPTKQPLNGGRETRPTYMIGR